jgi:hypothetical protein
MQRAGFRVFHRSPRTETWIGIGAIVEWIDAAAKDISLVWKEGDMHQCTAFEGSRCIASGELMHVDFARSLAFYSSSHTVLRRRNGHETPELGDDRQETNLTICHSEN